MSRKIAVVGTGSIGRRHIRNLVELGADVAAYRYRQGDGLPVEALPPSVLLLEDLDAAFSGPYDAVVVANRTDLHLAVALEAARHGKALFIEKPLSVSLAGIDQFLDQVRERCLVVEVGMMLRLHPNLCWLRSYLSEGHLGVLHYARAAVGQFLPDWRPESDHRLGYGAHRKTGGGVIFDLVHELDLITWLLGTVGEVHAMTAYVPALEIGTESIAQIGLRLESGVLAQVHLDYVRPSYGRTLEVVGSLGVAQWDYLAGTVTFAGAGGNSEVVHRVPSGFERNSMYLAHMRQFLNRLERRDLAPTASAEDGVEALRVALACHRSAEEGRRIRPDQIDSVYEVTGRQK